MSTSNHVAVSAGRTAGNSSATHGLVILLLTIAVLTYNARHSGTYLYYATYNPEVDNYIAASFFGAIGGLLAFMEIPATIMYGNARAYKESWVSQVGAGSFLLILVIMTTYMGSSSQNTQEETRNNYTASYQEGQSGFDDQLQAAQDNYDLALANAHNVSEANRSVYLASAKRRLSMAKVRISKERQAALRNKPLEQAHGAGFFEIDHQMFSLLFAFVLSLSAINLTLYKMQYIQAVMRIPVVKLRDMLDQDWVSEKRHYVSQYNSVNALKGIFSGIFTGAKRNVLSDSDTPRVDDPRVINPSSSDPDSPTGSADGEAKKHVECPRCEAVFAVTNSDLSAVKSGEIRCGECGAIFVGRDHFTQWPVEDTEIKQSDSSVNSSNSSNAGNPSIPEEFPKNSSQIPVTNHDDTASRNSSGITQELARNSSGIVNSQEFPKNSRKNEQVDLSHIAKSDPAEKKLADLASTIDQLSAKSECDGMKFSATHLQKELGMGYERIKPVFEIKQAEGKISQKTPYRIVYTGGAD